MVEDFSGTVKQAEREDILAPKLTCILFFIFMLQNRSEK
jgi:hypothetical protein